MHLVCPYCAHVTCSSTAHTENKAVVVKPHVYSLNMVLEKKSVVGQSGNSVGGVITLVATVAMHDLTNFLSPFLR